MVDKISFHRVKSTVMFSATYSVSPNTTTVLNVAHKVDSIPINFKPSFESVVKERDV